MASYLRAKGTQENNLSNLRRGVREKLRNGVFKLSHGRRGSRRSAVWEHFRMVEDEQGASVGYAGCLHCFDVLRHDAHVSGTSSLFSHLRSCPGPAAHGGLLPEPADLTEVIVKEELVEDDPQHGQQQDPELLEASVDWIASELMPAQVLHGEGFIRLAQLLVDCGTRQGTRDVIVLLPTQAQIEARMAIRAREERQKLRAELGDRTEHGASLVLCESPVQRGPRVLLLRTLYDWCFQTCLLGLCPPPIHVADHDEPRTGVATILKKFEMVESWEKLPLVSGGTMLDWETHVPCASHMLCKTVTHMLQAPHPLIQQVRGYIDKFRSLVSWAAHTQNKELTDRFPIVEEDQQSWLQTLAMVEGVCNMRTEIKRAGPRPELKSALGDTTQAVMKELISVLDPIRAAVTELEAPDTATLHKVVPWLLHIRNSCAIHDEDSETLAAMKTALQEGLDSHASPSHLHRVAVFFNPRMNSLKVLGVEEQQAVRQTVLHMTSREASSPSKRSKNKPEGPLAYLEDAREDALTAEKEMEVYAIMRDAANPDDLLAWWQRNAPLLPLLAAAATRILTTPASSAVTTFNIVSDKFLHLSAPESSTVDDLVFLHSRLVRS